MVDVRGVDYEGARAWVSVEGAPLTPGPSPGGRGGADSDMDGQAGLRILLRQAQDERGRVWVRPSPPAPLPRGERGATSTWMDGMDRILGRGRERDCHVAEAPCNDSKGSGRSFDRLRTNGGGSGYGPHPRPLSRRERGVDTKITRRQGVWPPEFLRFYPLPIPAATCGFHGGRW